MSDKFVLNHQKQTFSLFDSSKPLVEKSIAGTTDRDSIALSKMPSIAASHVSQNPSRMDKIARDEDDFLKENDMKSMHSRHNS